MGDPQEPPSDHDLPMTATQARAMLNDTHTPRLDEFRKVVPAMLTSSIVSILAGVDAALDDMTERLFDDGDVKIASDENAQMIMLAASLACADELDRRVPPREIVCEHCNQQVSNYKLDCTHCGQRLPQHMAPVSS